MTGAEILLDVFRREGVDILFGYPGGVVIPVFDALPKSGLNLVLTRHEQAAVHAADGYARASGKVGVCLVTSGPGATNSITGLANAKLDSVPMVFVSGQVATSLQGTDAFQETDMAGLTRSVCKHSYQVQSIGELPRIIKESFYIARSGRPGPVAVDLPVDVALAARGAYAYPESIDLPGYHPVRWGHPRRLRELARALSESRKPLLLSGGGIAASGAAGELAAFLEKTRIPVAVTMMGLGCVRWDHPQYLGMPGMHGRAAANLALSECDCLVAVGARFDDRVTGDKRAFASGAVVAHIDIDPAEIGKNVRTKIPIVGDAREVLRELTTLVKPRSVDEWNRRTERWVRDYPLNSGSSAGGGLSPQMVIDGLNRAAGDEAIVVTDVGQNQMWAALGWRHLRPRAFISSGGLGTMGFGLPAAIGAALACPERNVVAVCGDGGLQMNIQELATAGLNRIPVKIAVLNNMCLGMVRQWQELFWGKRYSKTCLRQGPECGPECPGPEGCQRPYKPDFVRAAEAFGLPGFRARTPAEAGDVIEAGFRLPGPVLMEFMIQPEENVFPMVPAGRPIREMVFGDSA